MGASKSWLTVIGVGPGSPEYLTPAACQAAQEAEILIGGRRALRLFADLPREKQVLSGDLEKVYTFLKAVCPRPTAVLVSGDPGFFSLLGWLKRKFPSEKITVIPGISSVQLAFARLGRGWEGATFLSLHGRPLATLAPYLPRLAAGTVKLALLTGGSSTPTALGSYLASHGLADQKLWVGWELGTEQEGTIWLTAAELAGADLPAAGVVLMGYEQE
ncbi:precorrin-6y C5,15-methyltransferase (decarboxylating) subunit CbiE [Moorella sp. Hama-1]|uniref:precorrin-6y C5,15-methyltransferase (decarboxylating) subunit CbiE n=1 Tax=Moorella sp. Hama-1 TaxID=2138101 RepID=UPI000D65CD71|nr:precorrin-6y C5,15-methyltransferase (decarboxylating) subunit CbiE [Moorella sp. Hama-1]MDN5361499.1 cobalt-precorrin-7 (C5)-methyltransferase [Moorella sp. (in: firmicutes)]BCV21177.1 precorrin-6y C5,15-methyltransferase (decarboxylating) subunit CbiE [Moorella sp. Hama-1]